MMQTVLQNILTSAPIAGAAIVFHENTLPINKVGEGNEDTHAKTIKSPLNNTIGTFFIVGF